MTTGNQFQKARAVLQSLIQGVDPVTGEEVPPDSIANKIEVNRALHTAVVALEQTQARLQRRAYLPASVGKTWSEEEEQALRAAFGSGDPVTAIAARHGRTVRAIEARLERLGLLRLDQRTTGNAFATQSRKERDE
jgi:hypothetical protein